MLDNLKFELKIWARRFMWALDDIKTLKSGVSWRALVDDTHRFTCQLKNFKAAVKDEGFIPAAVLTGNAMVIANPENSTKPNVRSWSEWFGVMKEAFHRSLYDTETCMAEADLQTAEKTRASLSRLQYRFNCFAQAYQQLDPRVKSNIEVRDSRGLDGNHLANNHLLSIIPVLFDESYEIK